MEHNLTSGSVFKNILYFSLPYFLSYFLQTLYGMADLFLIGRFCGVADITAVSIGSQIMHMLTVMIVGLAMGTTVMIGQNIGGGNKKGAAAVIGNSVSLFMLAAFALLVLLFIFVKHIAAVMSTPDEAIAGTTAYLTICFAGVPFCFSGYFCACGRSGLSFLHNVISIVFVRVPGAYIASKLFADTLFPMGIAAPLGSLLSVIVCVIAYAYVRRCQKNASG